MQAQQGEARDKFHSIHDDFSVYGAPAILRHVVENHEKRRTSELQLQKGDIIKQRTTRSNGYSFGWLQRSQLRGEYPSYKVDMCYDTFNFSSKVDF